MNIFVLSSFPKSTAQAHCDKHVVKMILETAQLLSTAHHIMPDSNYDNIKGIIYKKTHENHPCAIWVRASYQNYNWAYRLFIELLEEYTYRYNKIHASSRLIEPLEVAPSLPAIPQTPFAVCMPDEFKVGENNPILSYRKYYREGKSKLLKYTKRNPPSWLSLNSFGS